MLIHPNMKVAMIGCGEVGLCYARALASVDCSISVLCDEKPSDALKDFANETGATVIQQPEGTLQNVDLVISCVFGGVALDVFKQAARWIKPGSIFADFTTADPADMAHAESLAEQRGINFVDVAIMGAISATREKTPLICAGKDVEGLMRLVGQAGVPIRKVGSRPGEAATLKLLRSIFTKGMEALSIECLLAAEAKGLRPQLYEVLSDIDQMPLQHFMELSVRTHVIHAKRRLKEVQEAKRLMEMLAINPLVLNGVERLFDRTSSVLHTKPSDALGLEAGLSWLSSISDNTATEQSRRSN